MRCVEGGREGRRQGGGGEGEEGGREGVRQGGAGERLVREGGSRGVQNGERKGSKSNVKE